MSEGDELLNRLLSSEIKADLLFLFHRNPGLIDTLEGVARRIGRTSGSVESDVNGLVELGILGKRRIGKSEAVFMNRGRDREIQDIIARHLRNLDSGKSD